MPLQTLSVDVNAAAPYRIGIVGPDSLLPERTATGRVMVYDRWDNPITQSANITVQTIGDIQINGSNNVTLTTDTNGVAPFTLNSGKIG